MSDPVALALIAAAVTLLGNIIALWKTSNAANAAATLSRDARYAIDAVGAKTEIVHKAVNSQLDAFKREAAQQYALALEQAVNVVRLEVEKTALEKLAVLEAKIAGLQFLLMREQSKKEPAGPASDAQLIA